MLDTNVIDKYMNHHIIKIISNMCDFYTQIRLKKVNKNFDKIIKIISIPKQLHHKLDDDIISNYLYIDSLNLYCEKIISKKRVSMYNLLILNLMNNKMITTKGIERLSNLKSINIRYVYRIVGCTGTYIPNLRDNVINIGKAIKNLPNCKKLYLYSLLEKESIMLSITKI